MADKANEKAKEPKDPDQERSLWWSKPAKAAYVLFGLPALALLGWYFYTVAHEFKEPEVTAMEKAVAAKARQLAKEAAELAKKAAKENFKPEEVDNCRNVVEQYVTPERWTPTDDKMNELIGLPKLATKQERDERCIYFAKTVAEMEKMSHHSHHVFVCGGAIFKISGKRFFFIRPDHEGRGAVHNLEGRQLTLIPIEPGQSTVFRYWQIFNAGDGCIVVGMSRAAGTFLLPGHLIPDE